MFTCLNRKFIFLLVIAVMFGPYVHTTIGCDDDASAGSRLRCNLQPISHSAGAKDYHELPGDACCGLDLAVGVLAHSRQARAVRSGFAGESSSGYLSSSIESWRWRFAVSKFSCRHVTPAVDFHATALSIPGFPSDLIRPCVSGCTRLA